MLYIRGVVDRVNIRLYITEVLKGFQQDDSGDHISIKTDISEINIDVEKALTICLIVNELVANAVKYAFTGKSSRVINIIIKKDGLTGIICIISDNGLGYNRENTGSAGIGHSLVENFITKQLKGSWETNSSNGTTHKILIPLENNG